MKKILLRTLITLSLVLCTLGGVALASNESNISFLNDYKEFGIIANYVNQTGDMETNMLVGKFQSNGHTNGNTVAENRANSEGMIKIGEIIDKYQFRGNPTVIVDENIKTQVKKVLDNIEEYAQSVVNKNDFELTDVDDMNSYVIDITGIDKNMIYINANKLIDYIESSFIQNGGLVIKKNKEQTIILNITNKDTVTIPRYQVISSGTKEEIAETIIWNMPQVNHLEINSDNMTATIIAPMAYTNINVTGEGWLVTNAIVSNSGEWHCINRHIPEISYVSNNTKSPIISEKPEDNHKTTKHTSTSYVTNTPIVNITQKPTHTTSESTFSTPTRTPFTASTYNPTTTALPSTTPVILSISSEKIPKAQITIPPKKNTNITTILDSDVPLSNYAPETGDTIDLINVVSIMLLSLVFVVILIKIRK